MPTRHALLAAAVAFVWGINFVVIDVGLDTFPPLLFAALRFTLVVFPAIFFVRRPGVPWRWVVAVGCFLSMGQFGLLFVGMDRGMPAGLSSLVLQLQAAFTALLAVALLKEKLSPGQVAGALVAFGGIAIIGAGRAEGVPLGALLLTVGAAASWGLGNVCTRRAQAPDAAALLVWSSLIPPIPLALMSVWIDGPDAMGAAFTGLDVSGVLALLYVVIVSTAFGFGVWTWLLKRHPASSVAPFTLLVPVVGLLSAWIALDEVPNVAEAAGGLVVLGGLALTVRSMRASARTVREAPVTAEALSGAAPAR
ncbi:MAG TPA: EamA family transporter [Solirubrobacteraceae bacterium]|nr:EamA family transporter [Solirubrobacteraceae bacterium]